MLALLLCHDLGVVGEAAVAGAEYLAAEGSDSTRWGKHPTFTRSMTTETSCNVKVVLFQCSWTLSRHWPLRDGSQLTVGEQRPATAPVSASSFGVAGPPPVTCASLFIAAACSLACFQTSSPISAILEHARTYITNGPTGLSSPLPFVSLRAPCEGTSS